METLVPITESVVELTNINTIVPSTVPIDVTTIRPTTIEIVVTLTPVPVPTTLVKVFTDTVVVKQPNRQEKKKPSSIDELEDYLDSIIRRKLAGKKNRKQNLY